MAAAPTHNIGRPVVPFTAADGSATKDTTTGVASADAKLRVVIDLEGTVAALKADYATLLGTSLTATKARITHTAV